MANLSSDTSLGLQTATLARPTDTILRRPATGDLLESAPMRASRLRWLIPTGVFVAVVLIPLAVWGQTPVPGDQPEIVRPWTWWLSIPIALGALGLALLIGLLYVRVSSRFFAREEAPKIPPRPRAYAGVNAPAYPAPAAAQPAPAPAQPPEPEPEKPEPEKPEPEKPEPEKPEPEKPEPEAAEPEAAEPEPEKPEPEPEKPEPEAAEPEAAEPEPEEEKASAEGEKPAEEARSGDDVYERVLKEQLDKGVSPKVAEGRAKAAAHRARQSG